MGTHTRRRFRWTDDKIELLRKLYFKGYTADVMALKLRTTPQSIYNKIRRLKKDGKLNKVKKADAAAKVPVPETNQD